MSTDRNVTINLAAKLASADGFKKLAEAAEGGAIGIAGGDGTINAAAEVAHAHGRPLVVVPAGTLNHLARDLGLEGPDDTVAAVRDGHLVAVDLGSIDGKPFLNTASFGSYSDLVDARERLEDRIGKWPALLIALIRELPRIEPLRLTVDGEPRRVWLGWIGNGEYSPAGLAPAWREDLADGLLDIRLVHDGPRFSRTRFLCAALAGRLPTCRVYSEWRAASVDIVSLDGPLRLASDGETFDGPSRFVVSKRPRAVRVALPPPE